MVMGALDLAPKFLDRNDAVVTISDVGLPGRVRLIGRLDG
jgi:hypothetical protein